MPGIQDLDKTNPITLKCECCQHEQTFSSADFAFHEAGWDFPPIFPYTACEWCPGSFLALGINHDEIHEKWKVDGRPQPTPDA